jgi:hypothetical protein
MKDNAYFESLRKQYKPDNIKILFVGESRPYGNTFFYAADSNLYNYMKEAFQTHLEKHFYSSNEFLSFIKEKGFYIDDLCLEPVNNLSNAEKNQKRDQYVDSLANRIKEYKPEAIVIVLKGIQNKVQKAIEASKQRIDFIEAVSFPACGQQGRFRVEMKETLGELQQRQLV